MIISGPAGGCVVDLLAPKDEMSALHLEVTLKKLGFKPYEVVPETLPKFDGLGPPNLTFTGCALGDGDDGNGSGENGNGELASRSNRAASLKEIARRAQVAGLTAKGSRPSARIVEALSALTLVGLLLALAMATTVVEL